MKNIKSNRTILRRLAVTDLNNLQKLESNPLIVQFTPYRIPQTIEQTKIRLESQLEKQPRLEPFGIWVAELKEDCSFVGWFMLMSVDESQLEIGFMIQQSLWNQGLTTEICESLIQYARLHPQIEKIVAKTNIDNFASKKTLRKLKFEEMGKSWIPARVLGGDIELQHFELNLKTKP